MKDPNRPPAGPPHLFLLSFSILFLEMAAIRWMNASVPVLSYFNNFILISCFFGLGLGCLLAKRRVTLIRGFTLALLLLVALVVLLRRYGVEISYTGDYLFAANREFYGESVLRVSMAALAGFFVNVGFFVILGQELGRQLDAIGDPLLAYAYDIGGSLVGVVAYSLLAWAGTSPQVWYGIGILLLLLFVADHRGWLIASLVAGAAAIVLIGTTYSGARWSPYYKVEAEPYTGEKYRDAGFMILVDNIRIQDALNFGPALERSPLRAWIPYYRLPHRLAKPEKVLILGAGSGNEAIVALAHGAKEVHAVEIDPVIADFGEVLHPNHPYTREGVTVFVDDARSYISRTDDRYDLVVMSALDSHKQVAGMSSLRLESFVYTVESFARMKRLVKPGGVFCLNVSSYRPWIGDRVYWSLTEAFGSEPTVLRSVGIGSFSRAYVYAPEATIAALAEAEGSSVMVEAAPESSDAELATDDWPHLYLEGRRLPQLYLIVLGAMMVGSSVLVLRAEPSLVRPNLHFFFLGAGFMLLETRSVTQMALLFGSTWAVNSVVFASILLAIFICNHLVRKGRRPGRPLSYALLFVTLVLGYYFPFDRLPELGLPLRLLAAGLVIGLPIAWASFIFSISFQGQTQVGKIFGSNLLGIVFGGCLEYSSIAWGLDALYLVALVVYVVSAALLVPWRGGARTA